jgi:hypothetical protein
MAKRDPASEREERERREKEERTRRGQERHEDEHERREDQERPRRRRMGRDHPVHQQIVERRLGGGAPATPEAYAKALEEWKQLPGSVVRPPTDEKTAQQLKDKSQE